MMKKLRKKWLAFVLAIIMAIPMMSPVTAYAATGDEIDDNLETVVYVSQGYLDSNGWGEVYLHVWDNSGHTTSWPGLKAELQEEGEWKDYWKVTVQDIGLVGTIYAILDNGSSGTGNQYDVGTMLWGDSMVMTAGGEWMTEAVFKAPRVSASPDSPDFYGEELKVTLYAANVTDPTYQIDDGEVKAYEDGDSLTIGADINNGETVKLTLKGKNKDDETDIITKEYIYTKRYHEEQQSISVFFIGNSYTYYNDGVWSHFQKMAFEAGYNVEVDYVVIGSHYLDQFADFVNDEVGGGPTIEKKLAENDYDIVFLQEQSTAPLASYSRFENGATTLYNAIKASEGDDCRIILYQTWGRETGSSNLTQGGRGWTNETMTYDLRYAYTKVGEMLGVEVSPVGTAFHDVYANNGDKVDMYDDDQTHPKLPGTYLAALVHLATVFNDDDSVIDNAISYTAGLPESTVEILAQAAKDAPENAVKPHVYITPTDKDTITGSLTINLCAINVDHAEYQINDGEKVDYTYGDTVALSEGAEKLTLYGYDSEGQVVAQFEKTYEYEPARYLVIGWYENNNLSGLTEANVEEFAAALKAYLREEHGIAEELLANIELRPYVGMNVATLGSSVKADGDVDILIGVGANVDVPNASGATAGLTVIEKAGDIAINPAKSRYVARLTEKDIAETVYDWIVKTYGPEQDEELEAAKKALADAIAECEELDAADYTAETWAAYADAVAAGKAVAEDATLETINGAIKAIQDAKAALEEATVENPFGDVNETDWFYPYVRFAYKYELMGGKGSMPDGSLKFDPAKTITRAEFVQMLYSKEGKPAVEYVDTFTDVADDMWYTDAILWAAEKEIVGGKKADFFDVNGMITRQEIALILYKYALYNEYNTEELANADFSGFSDASKISTWAENGMKWAVSYDVIGGKTVNGETLLSPGGNAIRAEAATMMKAFMATYEGISE